MQYISLFNCISYNFTTVKDLLSALQLSIFIPTENVWILLRISCINIETFDELGFKFDENLLPW